LQAGVGRIVYTSLLHADTSPLSLADEHDRTEVELRASGVPYTILRNGWYTENYTASIAGAPHLGVQKTERQTGVFGVVATGRLISSMSRLRAWWCSS
jgi:uncharacterized protein YbjT (DUF2867 family)